MAKSIAAAQPTGISAFAQSKGFTNFILTIIFLNAVVIGFQAYPSIDAEYAGLFAVVDLIFLSIFAFEMVVKIIAYRGDYFKDGWNLFDFCIVILSFAFMNSQFVSMLRILRVLRILRTISSIRSLRRIVTSLFMAVPTIGSISLLMIIIFFIYAVVGATFFGEISPVFFGDLTKAVITLFQIATFDDWANIYRPIAEQYPVSLAYFVSFILVAVFIVLNLVVGEIVNNASNIPNEIEEDTEAIKKDVHEIKEDTSEIAQLRKEVRELKLLLLEERQGREVKSS
jgi:voltage-gated sodium channel